MSHTLAATKSDRLAGKLPTKGVCILVFPEPTKSALLRIFEILGAEGGLELHELPYTPLKRVRLSVGHSNLSNVITSGECVFREPFGPLQ